ncbi:MAG: rRNA pseudouridine synthase [Patescibacteria group bacterium]|nr:rRNA pseudouridine synthase [Patescibacteria group bacterium]MDE1965738.1 rRNA pseudouridine synthase [Patescibacteria group bacterium]
MKKRKAPKSPGARPVPKEGYPMRINKYLAREGVATRHGADGLVERGGVLINGRVARLGDKVDEGDRVELRGAPSAKRSYYFAYNKPVGVITHSPQNGERDIRGSIKFPKGIEGVFPVGRLDKDSHGLIILTNDGRVTDRLLNPEYEHDKEYRVRVEEALRDSFKKTMEAGVNIEGYVTEPCKIRKTGERTFSITLSEGKKHQIRRMVAALHNVVLDLERVRIMNITLGKLPAGQWRPIEGEELETFLAALRLPAGTQEAG